ncbi:signal transduction histidine kinase [Microbacterium sp. AK009]|uniref:sensor histidine kinase n=1 Tax=Microbacterium sp. AK009 TaxID=2723068 RepID=UPI0015CB77AE|nr:histidine kinase [Microbacterium sp. AK009]NYF15308.1 signal transduction histidine kinase [Microbacterium sp. AK009]
MFRPLRPLQTATDIAVAGGFFLVVVVFELNAGMGTTGSPNGLSAVLGVIGYVLLFSTALGFRRFAPGVALGLAWAGALLQMSLARGPSLVDIAVFGVLYTAAAYGSTRVFWSGFASALTGAVVITVYLSLGPLSSTPLDLSVLPVAVLILGGATFALMLAWTTGALVRTARRARENRLAQERAEKEARSEFERARIARDMHDVVAHSLAVVVAQADGARYAAAADPQAATDALQTISSTARAALADVRLLLTQLRHSQGDGPQPSLADLEELWAQVRAAGVDLRVDIDPAPPGEPPASVQIAVYRILQEALTNALRHGQSGGPVDVRLSWGAERVDLTVRNPVVAGSSAPARTGHGVIGMRERTQLAGGDFAAAEESGAFVVRASIPVEALA